MRVNRNYFGRQTESFEAPLDLPFLVGDGSDLMKQTHPTSALFNGIFIRAPVVEKMLPVVKGAQVEEAQEGGIVMAPSRNGSEDKEALQPVEVMATLPGRSRTLKETFRALDLEEDIGDIVAVRQANVFGTSFHPELTDDVRIHVWWLRQVKDFHEMR